MSLWNEGEIVIKSTQPIKSDPREVKADRIQVLLEMNIEYYHQFRAQIEAPDALRDRRSEDKRPEATK